MGTKIKHLVIFSMTFFCHLSSAQINESKIKYMKKYAYCSCVYINNNIVDSTYLQDKFQLSDKSENQFIDLGKITNFQSNEIRQFTEKQTKDFTVIESSYHSETGISNTITADCMNFYESKELDNYVKKLLGIYPKQKISKKKK